MAERHFSQHVPFGKNPCNPKLAVDHRDRSHMMVQHFMNGVGHRGFYPHRGNLPITKVQHAHKSLLRLDQTLEPNSTRLNQTDALCSQRTACQGNLRSSSGEVLWELECRRHGTALRVLSSEVRALRGPKDPLQPARRYTGSFPLLRMTSKYR